MKKISQSFEKIKARIKSRPQVTIFTLLKYSVYFALMVLFANAKTVYGLSPFSLGFLVGLVFAKQNLLALAPMYILAALTSDFSVYNLIFATSPIVVLAAVYLIFFKLNRSVAIPALMAASLVSLLPYAVITLINSDAYLTVSLNIILTLFFAYCSQIGCYAILFRGINYRLSLDELLSLAALLLSVSLSLYANPIFGFNLFYLFFAYLIMFASFAFPPSIALVVSVISGLGCALAFTSAGVVNVAACALIALAVIALKPFTKYASAFAALCADALLALYVGISGYDYLQLISVGAGLILFLLTPRKIVETLSSSLGGLNGSHATRNIVNQNRNDLSNKLQYVSRIFWNMSNLLGASNPQAERYSPARLSENIAASFCGSCSNHESCFAALATDTRGVLQPMVEASLARDKITILDMPPFITSRCNNMQGLVTTINKTGERAKKEAARLLFFANFENSFGFSLFVILRQLFSY